MNSSTSLSSVIPSQRPLLQRRNSLSNTFQALVDGSTVVALVAGLAFWVNGAVTMPMASSGDASGGAATPAMTQK